MPNCRKPIPTPYREYAVPERSSTYPQTALCHSDFPLAMAYIPWQRWGKTYSPEEALRHGTLFPELFMPLTCRAGGECHEHR